VYNLHQVAPGQWLVSIPLSQGVHDYAFVIDGSRWVADPYAASVSDGFGGINSRLTLLSSNTPQT
jgi:1,4-alpha-glucan branching enzyme